MSDEPTTWPAVLMALALLLRPPGSVPKSLSGVMRPPGAVRKACVVRSSALKSADNLARVVYRSRGAFAGGT